MSDEDAVPIGHDTTGHDTTSHGVTGHGVTGKLPVLVLGCIGVVYGDIGTSPLYAMRESLRAAGENGLVREDVMGIVSLLLWTLILIVSVKYVVLIMRADNQGEGGTLSLVALIQQALRQRPEEVYAVFAKATGYTPDAVKFLVGQGFNAYYDTKDTAPSAAALTTLFQTLEKYEILKSDRPIGPAMQSIAHPEFVEKVLKNAPK